MAGRFKQKLQKYWKTIKRVFLFLFISQFIYILLLKWVDPPFTITQLVSLFTGDGLNRDYVEMKDISSNARLAVISSEDQLFPEHNGFDWKSIEKARSNNSKRPKKIKGGSSISQQVAKNVFLWQGRSYFRKGLEVYFTFMIELIWGKRRILEVYLNVIEMGRGIYGIEAASQTYYKKSARQLTMLEAAKIAACLPNPKKYTVKPLSSWVSKKSVWIVTQMKNLQDDPPVLELMQ